MKIVQIKSGNAEEFYNSAKIAQGLIRSEFVKAFQEVDLLFSPVTPSRAFEFGKFNDNKLLMDLQDYFTCSVNLAGIPALSIPCGLTQDNMPIGFQLIGPDLSEQQLYKTGYIYEREMQHLQKFIPKGFE